MSNQASLVNVDEYRKFKTRGKYNTKPKKDALYDPWTEMKDLYQRLARFIPFPLFSREDEIITQGIIKGWYFIYTDEKYEYEGEECIGENFQVFEAEIIGTENWLLEDRIEIHKAFIPLLEQGMPQEQAEEYIKTRYNLNFNQYAMR